MTWLNWPNRLTIARIILVAPLVICMLNLQSDWPHWRRIALAIFVVMAITDALDGYLARRLGEETALGRFLDPVADKLLITSAVILLALDSTSVEGFRLPSWVPVIAIGKDILTTIGFGLIYATTGEYFIQPRIWGKACTAVQLGMIAFCLLAPDVTDVFPPTRYMIMVMYDIASGLAIVAVVDYIRIGNRFAAGYHAKKQGKISNE